MTERESTAEGTGTKPPRRVRRAYDELLLKAHVEHHTVEAICSSTGLSRSTVQRWRRDPANQAEVEAARGDVVRGALARLRNGLGAAADRLLRVVEGSEREDVAVRAAVAMFSAHQSLAERQEFEERLSALELAVTAKAHPPEPRHSRGWRPTLLGGGTP